MVNAAHIVLGALVADAASLGVHWIYDPDRIAEIAERQGRATGFTPIDPANYEGVPSYFAHAARRDGMLSQYGECLWLAVQSMVAHGGSFDVATYTSAFAAHFGPGGSYQGYIDRPTRGALENISAEQEVTGIDDDQLPALTRLPALVAAGSQDVFAAMQITNVNAVAAQYSAVFSDLLTRVKTGENLPEALRAAAQGADPTIRPLLTDALETSEQSSTDYAAKTGRACHLPMAGPLMFHILAHSDSYREAVERNDLAGGDNAGRSLVIGAVMGAVHGVATDTGIPLDWVLKLQDGDDIWAQCQALAAPA